MRSAIVDSAPGLWEAWIDMAEVSENYTLYVVGDVCTGKSKTRPVLIKKHLQGIQDRHLVLEVLPFFDKAGGRMAEVRYAEPLTDIHRYEFVSICVGEDIIARIPFIEVVC